MSAFLTSDEHPISVAKVVCDRWQKVGQSAELLSWVDLRSHLGLESSSTRGIIQTVVVWHLHRIECIVAANPDWQEVQAGVGRLTEVGWRVTILAPLANLGSAHNDLVGSTACVQGWWTRGNNEFHFTREETI